MRLLLLLLLLLAVSVEGWGPLSHGTFNCLGLFPKMSVRDCLQQPAQRLFAVGSDMPDAFGFADFNLSAVADPKWQCKALDYVHDPIFAGEQILFALNYTAANTQGKTTFDPLLFSKGFAGHIVGDLVGFNPLGGILCSKQAASCTGAGILYVPEWGYMSALDAYFYANYSLDASQLPISDEQTLGTAAYNFISEATVHYNKINPNFKPVSAVAVKQCADYWAGNMKYVYQRAAFYAASPANQQFLHQELTFFAPVPSSSDQWPQVETFLRNQVFCSSSAVSQYMKYLLVDKTGSKQAWAQTAAFVQSLYAKSQCQL